MLARHVSDPTGPSSERFLQAVFADLVCGNTVRTAGHVQPLDVSSSTCITSTTYQICEYSL